METLLIGIGSSLGGLIAYGILAIATWFGIVREMGRSNDEEDIRFLNSDGGFIYTVILAAFWPFVWAMVCIQWLRAFSISIIQFLGLDRLKANATR